MSNPDQEKDANWERNLVHRLASAAVDEKRRHRRWGIFFKFLTFIYLAVLLVLWFPDQFSSVSIKPGSKHTALVEIKGVIAADAEASADNVVTGLREAFEDKHTKGVILRINSPGGSPVQAGYINDEIYRLKKKYPDIPLYAVITDICASGGYYIAVAADQIYVDKASIVGSIGVLMSSFGFVEGMETMGVERRLLIAGEHKAVMDPFLPFEEYDRSHIQGLLDEIHQQFIRVVRKGRGERLKETDDIFSGLFWSGEQSINMGLADAIGSASYVAREVIEAEDIVDFTPQEDVFERLAKRVGAGAVRSMAGILGVNEGARLR